MNTLKYLPLLCFASAALADAPGLLSAQSAPQAAAIAPRKILVASPAELRRALAGCEPGTRIEIAGGQYPGAFYFSNVRGTDKLPITIAGADPQQPPVFSGLQFSDPAFLTIQDIAIEKSAGNGLNIDDGGDMDGSARHITLRRVRVSDVSGEGNLDGIKLSGLENFSLQSCVLERWGSAGSGVDMVGCRSGVIDRCTFRHLVGVGDSGVQTKGGSRDIQILGSRFENAGSRAINVGGSTSLSVFRPPLGQWFPNEAKFEAKDIRVQNNTFVGSAAPLAFVGVDGAIVRFNTLYKPERWALRILQETTEAGFAPCRNVLFESNLIVFDSARWIEGGVNIGPGTEPNSFRFKSNWWFCEDKPQSSRPRLPVPEEGGVYGQDPLLRAEPENSLSLGPESPARKAGAGALSF